MAAHQRDIVTYATAIFCLSVMEAGVNFLADRVTTQQIIFYRALFGVLPVVFYGVRSQTAGRLAFVRTKAPVFQVLRGLSGSATLVFFILALRGAELSAVVGLSLLAPLVMIAMGWTFLGERFGSVAVGWILVGLLGAGLIIQPNGDIGVMNGLYALASVFFHSVAAVFGRILAQSDGPSTTAFYTNLMAVVVGALAIMFLPSEAIGTFDFAVCFGVGLVGGISYILLVVALRGSEIHRLAHLEYSAYAWALVFGFVIFAETPSPAQVAGVSLIVISGVLASRAVGKTA